MKLGDKVRFTDTTSGVTYIGEISAFLTRGKVEVRISPFLLWILEPSDLTVISSLPDNNAVCGCGAAKVGSDRHTEYCEAKE